MENSSNADRYITFTDDSGKEVQFEFLDLINYEDEGYVVLLPSDSDGTVVILKVTGEEGYVSEEDEETLRAVFGLFKKAHPELKFEEKADW
ncbi:DUF1292 domain-containing protein [Blautia sp. MCC283]|uniref:DUF1292 domain-containing protein n=1 Tax=Blautia sp. MCC283 TaxID=2592640 RepID=UPI001C00A730|nr:DUF1292 domain-containing protein [Blautia sp. MCC283]MBT9841455.1 DUF1292 domain-containing protein [Blautia sp. MCC283]